MSVSGPWLLSSSSDQMIHMATSDDTKTEEENTKTTNEDIKMKTKVYNKDNEMALDFVFSWRDWSVSVPLLELLL